jgi:hypothetical protein
MLLWPLMWKATSAFVVVGSTARVVAVAGGDNPVYSDPAFWITPGGLLVALALGLLVPKPTYDREKATADRLTTLFETRMLDLAETYAVSMNESSRALERSSKVLENTTSVQQEVLAILRSEDRPPPRRRGT